MRIQFSIQIIVKHLYYIFYIILPVLGLTACTEEVERLDGGETSHSLCLTAEVAPFTSEDGTTRSKIDGTGFEVNDWIRLKVICPFVSSAEYTESTYSGSFDAFYLLKYNGGSWVPLQASDKCDITGSYTYSDAPSINNWAQAQQTPHVYMASTWTEEKNFRTATSGSGHVLQYSHVFHADQRDAKNYKASDLLWAQQYMQTGAWNVHLSFEHKMACLLIDIDDSGLHAPTPADPAADDEAPAPTPMPLTDATVVTIEGMPDIDQQEVIVGDYYAPKSKINSGNYCYRNRNSSLYEYNGRVIGIAVNLEQPYDGLSGNRAYAWPMTGNPNPAYDITFAHYIPNTGVYTAYKVPGSSNRQYRLIVPPCVLTTDAHIWIRDGERRFMMPLPHKTFREGELYNVKVTIKE